MRWVFPVRFYDEVRPSIRRMSGALGIPCMSSLTTPYALHHQHDAPNC
jgi:hypothetical protein